jgi:hypothetical protein
MAKHFLLYFLEPEIAVYVGINLRHLHRFGFVLLGHLNPGFQLIPLNQLGRLRESKCLNPRLGYLFAQLLHLLHFRDLECRMVACHDQQLLSSLPLLC